MYLIELDRGYDGRSLLGGRLTLEDAIKFANEQARVAENRYTYDSVVVTAVSVKNFNGSDGMIAVYHAQCDSYADLDDTSLDHLNGDEDDDFIAIGVGGSFPRRNVSCRGSI